MRFRRPLALSAAVMVLAVLAAACGDDDNPTVSGSGAQKGTLTIGSTNFNEAVIVAHMYAGALRAEGYTVNVRANLGSREVLDPALQRGEIDMYPGYAATELEHYNKGANEATADARTTVQRLNTRIDPMGLVALDASPAVDQNAFGVTQVTADRLKVTKLSDLAPVAGQLTLGGPPECPTRPFCAKGLEDRYGIKFKEFKPLDVGGPLTKTALRGGNIDVGLLLSSDARGFVVLQDDKGLQLADNIVPVLRKQAATDEVKSILNRVSAALTSEELSVLNDRAATEKADADVLAETWLKENGFKK